MQSSSSSSSWALYAKKQKKKSKPKSSGGGFASKAKTAATTSPVSADKNALETQWDTFASVTDLEIAPPGDPDDEDYQHFIVTDVFVRVGPADDAEGSKPGTGWYRTGKVVAADDTDINVALTLQKGLILWTSVHMWPQLAAKGKEGAKQLQVGYMQPSMYMAEGWEGALDEEEAEDMQMPQRVAVQGVSIKTVGFRPDFNPPGFTYKRREKAAMKKKKSALDEIAEAS